MKNQKTIHSSFYAQFVAELTNSRQALNISQSDLATKTGLSQSDISKIENAERRLDVYEFHQIFKVFNAINPEIAQTLMTFLERGHK